MGIVHVLNQETINQIAAGEVIERPASVVKELVENALDSGATGITVEAEQGGISMLRVSDNGSGFASDDIRTAFLRHATSKIETGADLFRIHSLGFRGEALSSIAAVAKVELLTYNTEDYLGSRYVIEGGEEVSLEEAGCPQGTTIFVRDLFYNVPARRKFLKTPVTETGYINELMVRFAIAHPEISFSLISQGKTLLHTPGNGKLRDAVYATCGREIADNLMTVDKETEAQGHLLQHRYPFTALSITIRPETIDVNVHPTKNDIRFSDRDTVYNTIVEAVREAFRESILIPNTVPGEEIAVREPKPTERPAEVFETHRRSTERYITPEVSGEVEPVSSTVTSIDDRKASEEPVSYTAATVTADQAANIAEAYTPEAPDITAQADVPDRSAKDIEPVVPSEVCTPLVEKPVETLTASPLLQREIITGEQMSFMDTTKEPEYRIVGQVFDRYWIIQLDHEMLMVDQHAAHEKINYERLLKQVTSGEVFTQHMTPPAVITLTIREEEALQNNLEYFTKLGFEIRSLGGREYGIFGVPTALFDIAPQEYFAQTLDRLTEGGGKEPLLRVLERLASMSCKAAIKGGQTISYSEADHLIAELLKLDNPYQCPHGRPTIISMSEYELEKKFKRIV